MAGALFQKAYQDTIAILLNTRNSEGETPLEYGTLRKNAPKVANYFSNIRPYYDINISSEKELKALIDIQEPIKSTIKATDKIDYKRTNQIDYKSDY